VAEPLNDCCSIRVERGKFEGALKLWHKQCEKSGLLRDLRRRESYTPPSAARRIKSHAARKRLAS
jgi:ribosomal protein S21